jgi:adenylate kinase
LVFRGHPSLVSTSSDYSKFRIGLTGSPGTGKKTVAKILAEKTDLTFFSINDFAIENSIAERSGKEFLIDPLRLKNKIKTRGRIVVGHLLPYVIPNRDLDLVIILRCSPAVLRTRYLPRKYSEEKIRENIEAEMIGLISAECARVYNSKKLAEFDTSRTKPTTTARKAIDIINGRAMPTFGSIDWLSHMSLSTLEEVLRGKCNRFNRPKRITRFANPKARKSR